MNSKTILLTIDLEDWFQVENFKQYISFSDWEKCEWRFEKNVLTLLNLFDQYRIRSTFFVLGWNAERAPALVREIQSRGHEIASHGYTHDLCPSLDADALYSDLKRSKDLLEEICGSQIKGYRAPSFSVSDEVIKLLKRAGYQYDSSYDSSGLNSRHGKIKLETYKKTGIAYRDTDGFAELPVSNLQIARTTVPWGGGGYFRLLPNPVFNAGVRKILNSNDGYMFYTHPWEFDPEQPRVKQASASNRFRHYVNLGYTESKLRRFINTFSDVEFLTCQQYLANSDRINKSK